MAGSLIDSMKQEFVVRRMMSKDRLCAGSIMKIAQILSNWLTTSSLCYTVFPANLIDFTESKISQYLEQVESSNQFGKFEFFSLSDHPIRPEALLSYTETIINERYVQDLYFPLTWSSDRGDLLEIDSFLEVILDICNIINADFGWIRDYKISRLFGRSLREYNYEISRASAEEREYISPPCLSLGIEEDPLPELLFSSEFDILQVSDGVW